MGRRGVALITVLIMTSVLSMMLIALYVSARNGILAATVKSRRVAAQYVADAGLVETMEALKAGSYSMTSGQLTGSLSSGGTYSVEFKDSPPFGPFDSVNNINNTLGAAESHHGPQSVPPEAALIAAFQGL